MILDIHTHHNAPQPEGVISIRLSGPDTEPSELYSGQLYSAGIHPWDTIYPHVTDTFPELDKYVRRPDVIAIGECGFDLRNGGPMFRQLQVFKKHVELSEELCKPLIIHDVKADDIICGLRRDLRPGMPWAIHGFRGKPAAALALLRAGCYLSFGEKFNPDTLLATPLDRVLAETDESSLTIEKIISTLSDIRGCDLTDFIICNSKKFCNFVD